MCKYGASELDAVYSWVVDLPANSTPWLKRVPRAIAEGLTGGRSGKKLVVSRGSHVVTGVYRNWYEFDSRVFRSGQFRTTSDL